MEVLNWNELSKKKNEEIAQLKARIQELESVCRDISEMTYADYLHDAQALTDKVLRQQAKGE